MYIPLFLRCAASTTGVDEIQIVRSPFGKYYTNSGCGAYVSPELNSTAFFLRTNRSCGMGSSEDGCTAIIDRSKQSSSGAAAAFGC